MIWTLVRQQLLADLLTLRTGVPLLFTVGLIALAAIIGSLNCSRPVADNEQVAHDSREELEKATVYARMHPAAAGAVLVVALPQAVHRPPVVDAG